MGDLICATPVFKQIKKKYPKSFLTVTVANFSGTEGIIKNNQYVDEIIILEDDEYLDFFGIFRFFKKIKKRKFNWSINLESSAMGTLISVFGLIPNRIKIIKYDRPFAEVLNDWMNTHKTFYKGNERIPNLYLRTLNVLNIPMPDKIRKEVFTTSDTENKSADFFRKKNILDKDFVIGVSVTAGNKVKEWGTENFLELLSRILEKHNVKIVFIGTQKDKEKISIVNQSIENKGIVATDFSIEELPSLMKRFSMFISADTGPIHIAEALSVPLIDIIGPIDPDEQAPVNEISTVVKSPESFPPTVFALRRQGDPKESKKAMESISVDMVFKAFDRLFLKIKESR
jgi:ADP-heptose:LPS heptosyltransferase|tara:strand:+ start:366 stop:1394 length:1029 start_codon:yes stop_codon:yes gene_type:complete